MFKGSDTMLKYIKKYKILKNIKKYKQKEKRVEVEREKRESGSI